MKRPLRLIIGAGIALVLFYFVQEVFFNEDNYLKPLLQERKDKDLSFRSRANSPFTDEGRRAFTNLTYYEPDLDYRVQAKVEPPAQQDTLLITLTNGSYEPYLRYGIATFEIEGQPQQLTLYKKLSGDEGKLFVPFTDKTNGFETYGGGRYLDVPYEEGDKTVVLDFNRAYSPFCAFNPEYVCPVPPKDNRLSIAIPAGEKTYEAAH
ncbi:hypothetical protein CLV24_10577 [Pontibacter ummariensis]|uniref:DUF1684 domain-containing protein n=1 Tax=Pontibacter ummariensis TaxID=1610492 RepID=A0A239DZD6_9BACT|nr:DUF1684 domain-containing protein [Pontibacter ummariensis]PRY13707.1 hypothetical protein CLV24_10577 [Pontibacter ummariensis]SNS37083.1 hypothetical protein SAMN06296052_105174 [Pontibacter ummariensis]